MSVDMSALKLTAQSTSALAHQTRNATLQQSDALRRASRGLSSHNLQRLADGPNGSA